MRSWPHISDADDVRRAPRGYVHLSFNLRQPIDEQLERAKHFLKLWQAGHIESGAVRPTRDKRVNRKLLPLYLRVLDAEDAGATPEQIAEHLNNERPDAADADLIRKYLLAARRYRDRDYVVLLERSGDFGSIRPRK